jgi:ABC-2 type transport system ATP-binding protein
MLMIRFEGVTKLYKTVLGVNDISLELAPGAYGLLGPNGSGKTTFINLILGQLRPTLGSVRVFDQDPWRRSDLLRRVGVCPAVDILLPNVTALDWVRYLVRMHGFSAAEAARRAEAALEIVGMQHAMRRPIGSYSLGMRQRCKIAQAIAHEPELLILDEPFNGLDPVGRHELTELFLRWIGEGKSFLLASHLLHEVEAVRPSFLLISGGRLLASGSPQEVHAMLADLPGEVHVRVDRPKDFAARLCEVESVDSVRIDSQLNEVAVSTRRPLVLSQRLPAIVSEGRFEVLEVRSGQESLQHLFTTLMRMHRGEL